MSFYGEAAMRETARRDREIMDEVDRAVEARHEREREYYRNRSYYDTFIDPYERFVVGGYRMEADRRLR